MASKRAIPLLAAPFRASSTVVRRSRPVSRCANIRTTREFGNVCGIRSVGSATVRQVRWHSRIPEETKSRMLEFEDVRKIVEDPSNNIVLVDVREPAEYNANAIPTAFNIPVTSQPDALLLPEEEFEDRFGFTKPPLEKEIVFYCKAGVRSAAAAQLAKQGGYQNVGEYRGSWLDWERKGGVGTKSRDDGVEKKPGDGADTSM